MRSSHLPLHLVRHYPNNMDVDSSVNPPYRMQKRKRNFTETEADILIRYVMEHYPALHNNQGHNLNVRAKQAMWQQVTDQVNAMGVERRTVTDIKKRWQDEKRRIRDKVLRIQLAAAFPGGGLGNHERLTPREQAVCALISPQTAAESGIGGLDTSTTDPDMTIIKVDPDEPTTSQGRASKRRESLLDLQATLNHQEDSDSEDKAHLLQGHNAVAVTSSRSTDAQVSRLQPQKSHIDIYGTVSSLPTSHLLAEDIQDDGMATNLDTQPSSIGSPGHPSQIMSPEGPPITSQEATPDNTPVRTPLPQMSHSQWMHGAMTRGGENGWESDFYMQPETVQESLTAIQNSLEGLRQDINGISQSMLAQTDATSDVASAIHHTRHDLQQLLMVQHQDRVAQHQELIQIHHQTLDVFSRIATAIEHFVGLSNSATAQAPAQLTTLSTQTSPPQQDSDVEVPEAAVASPTRRPVRGTDKRRRGQPRHPSPAD